MLRLGIGLGLVILRVVAAVVSAASHLLAEDGSRLLTEDGNVLVIE